MGVLLLKTGVASWVLRRYSLRFTPYLGDTMSGDYPYQAVPFTQVKLSDPFWGSRIETNRTVTIPIAFKHCEDTHRMWCFDLAAGKVEGDYKGDFPFNDTDVYKIIEGASFSMTVHPDPELDAYVDSLIERIADAQEDDGYLYTARTCKAEHLRSHWMGENRYDNVWMSHELYNAGHLFEASHAHYLATGKTALLEVAKKFADRLDEDFGWDKIRRSPGHQVTEMGLVKLYQVTGEKRYLDLAKFFLDVRSHEVGGGKYSEYNQSHKPVIEQDEATGHSVRAGYMYAGMADVAAIDGDEAYIRAIKTLWDNVTDHKTYITGGIGQSGSNEGFLENDNLPNMSAYCETCASIANVYWNHRLFMLEGKGEYIDVLERSLYNAMLSGVSLSGDKFFYPNPLASHGQHQRSEWFGCACCPSNVCRFMASIPGYVYAQRNSEVYVNLFVEGQANLTIDGTDVTLGQTTNYPWDGAISVQVDPAEPKPMTVCLRIPGWAREEVLPGDQYHFLNQSDLPVTATLNGEPIDVKAEDGYLKITRTWQAGDVVGLDLPMPIRRVLCNDRVEENRGRVTLQRGPMVYCVEFADNDGSVVNLLLDDAAEMSVVDRPELLGGVKLIQGHGSLVTRDENDALVVAETNHPFTAIPYYAWSHRGPGEMEVWIIRDPQTASPPPSPTIAFRSQWSCSTGRTKNMFALADQLEPQGSSKKWQPFFTFCPKKGTTEWVQYDFEKTETVSKSAAYWFADAPDGKTDFPVRWQLLYRVGDGEWTPVPNPSEYLVEADQFCEVTFDPITADAMRLEVTLKPDHWAGMHEWSVE